MVLPERDDVVIQRTRGLSAVYLLGTAADPDQFMARTRDEAVAQAVAHAERLRVRVWFVNGDERLVLLGTFRHEAVESV